jgi:hypothetical protein
MTIIGRRIPGRPIDARRWRRRSALAAPFALSLGLTLMLGPGTIDSRHGSFIWLAVVSLVGAVLMLTVRSSLLIPLGVATFLVFPVSAGLGFHFAPAWAVPIVAIILYGSMLASLAAVLVGTVVVLRGASRRTRLAAAVVGGGFVVAIALAAVWAFRSGPSGETSLGGRPATAAVNLGPVINTSRREAEASFTADGRTMYYNCDDYDLCVSHLTGTWAEGQWTRPQLRGPRISTAYFEVEPWITPSGDKLYFNSNRPFADGDALPGLSMYVDVIGLATTYTTDRLGFSLFRGLGEDELWVSNLVDGAWSDPRNLNDLSGEPSINTSFADHCLAFSADGNEAYWTSNRPGGFGGDDIWTSRRVNGTWTAAVNLGPSINGPGGEHHSSPSPDGRELYLTSNRAGGFGGEDIYVSIRVPNGHWGRLVNAGATVNGPGTDRCAAWTPDGRIFLFDSDRAGGFGTKDIWWVPFKAVKPTAESASAPEPRASGPW